MEIIGKTVIITGAGGAICSAIAKELADNGAIVCLLGRTLNKLKIVENSIKEANGQAYSFSCDVLDENRLDEVFRAIKQKCGKIDALINGAGGNMAGATVMPDQEFYNIESDALNKVIELNLQGTIIPSKVASKFFIDQGYGNIINISSMAASRPMTRVAGYAAAKAGIDNFTKWLSVELSSKHGENIRVNAVAPGFIIAEQNRKLLLNKDGSLTPRGKTIVDSTPFKRFGKPEDIVGICHFLLSDASKFITGTIIPVDGGFSAFSGV